MDKTELTILGSAAAVALVAAAGVLLWIFVIAGGGEDENLDDPLIESRLAEMEPLCVDITLSILTRDEITRTTGVANDRPFFHESAVAEEALGMPYSEISAECTRAAVRGFDASGEYFEHVSVCSNALREDGAADKPLREDAADKPLREDAADKPPIERLRQVIACADDRIGIGAADEDAVENPDEQAKG